MLQKVPFLFMQRMYRFKTQRTQAGQGLVEYLLILVLTLSIILAVLRGVGSPLVDYMKDNVFGMIGCMLRRGEYPARAFGACGGTKALKLNLKEQLDSTSGSSTGGSGSSNNSTGSDSSSSSNSSNIKEPDGRGSIDGSSRSTNTEFGSGDSPADSANKRIKIASALGGDESFGYDGGTNNQVLVVRRIRRRGGGEQISSGFSLVGREEAINAGEVQLVTPEPSIKKVPREDIRRPKVSSFSIRDTKKTDTQIENQDISSGFSFMQIIKWALIIAIIVIFGLFSLSQLNSIRKGWTE